MVKCTYYFVCYILPETVILQASNAGYYKLPIINISYSLHFISYYRNWILSYLENLSMKLLSQSCPLTPFPLRTNHFQADCKKVQEEITYLCYNYCCTKLIFPRIYLSNFPRDFLASLEKQFTFKYLILTVILNYSNPVGVKLKRTCLFLLFLNVLEKDIVLHIMRKVVISVPGEVKVTSYWYSLTS